MVNWGVVSSIFSPWLRPSQDIRSMFRLCPSPEKTYPIIRMHQTLIFLPFKKVFSGGKLCVLLKKIWIIHKPTHTPKKTPLRAPLLIFWWFYFLYVCVGIYIFFKIEIIWYKYDMRYKLRLYKYDIWYTLRLYGINSLFTWHNLMGILSWHEIVGAWILNLIQ